MHKNHNLYPKQDLNNLNVSNARVKNHNYQHEQRGCMHRGYMHFVVYANLSS